MNFLEAVKKSEEDVAKVIIDQRLSEDWLLKLFFPIGCVEIFEDRIFYLMLKFNLAYSDVMSLPVSRRERLAELRRELDEKDPDNGVSLSSPLPRSF